MKRGKGIATNETETESNPRTKRVEFEIKPTPERKELNLR